jgi:hypothetical protein
MVEGREQTIAKTKWMMIDGILMATSPFSFVQYVQCPVCTTSHEAMMSKDCCWLGWLAGAGKRRKGARQGRQCGSFREHDHCTVRTVYHHGHYHDQSGSIIG